MNQRKYIYIIPLLTSALFLASVAAVITNGITFNEATVRNFNVNNIEAGEFETSLLTIPTSMSRARLDISVTVFQSGISGSPVIDIYILDEEPPNELQTEEQLVQSTFFENARITGAEDVESQAILYMDDDYEQVYLVLANPFSLTVDVFVTISIDDESSFSQAGQVVKIVAIVISAILTIVFLVLSVYFWLEVLAYDFYEPKVLTLEVEERMSQFVDKAESWELFLIATALILFPTGLVTWLISGFESGISWGGFILIAIVFFSYNNRNRTYDAITTVLRQKQEIHLDQLSQQIDKDNKETKKAVMNLIMYGDFPATYNFDTDVVSYHPDGVANGERKIVSSVQAQTSTFQVPAQEVISGENRLEEDQPKRPLPECAYCGEVAIIHTAQFCHSCGASMSSAK